MDWQSTAAAVFLLIVTVFYWIRSRYQTLSTFSRRGIPGPKPSFIYANVTEAWKHKKPWLVIHKWSRQYGKIFGCFPMGVRPILVITDRSVLKEILVRNFSNFRNRPALGPPRAEPASSTLTSLRGQRWKRVRGVISPTFATKKIRQMLPSMNIAADTFITMLKHRAAAGQNFDIYQMFQALTLDVIAQSAFALKVDSQIDPQDTLLSICRQLFKSIFTPALKLLLLFPELVPAASLMQKKMGYAKQEFFVITHMRRLVEERRKSPPDGNKNMDMIQLMMDAADHVKPSLGIAVSSDAPYYQASNNEKYLTENELVANCFVFLLAGYETTANALAFTTYLLAQHADVQARLFRCIVDQVAFEDEPDFDAAQLNCKIEYLDAVIRESLRMYPPITGFVMRECQDTCWIKGMEISSGMAIHIPVWTLHHDPELWPEPDLFLPDRFLPNSPFGPIPEMAYMPFGDGPRNCIGMSFAMMEIRVTLVRLLQNYVIQSTYESGAELELESPFVTMNPAAGVMVNLQRRVH